MRITSVAQSFALGLAILAAPAVSRAQIGFGISIRIGPPALPVYVQPPCPIDGYLWNPGYWAYGQEGYYWVPGVWVSPPRIGVLWTPGYWGFESGLYGWHGGYWGPHVGFYGGVNYGFGFGGVGFIGGGWQGNVFRYNTAVVNVNTTVVRNVYVDRTVINNSTVVNRASFNGPGGVQAQATPQQRAAMSEPHIAPTANQVSHEQVASRDHTQLASVNGGRPAAAAMDRVGGQKFNPQGRAPGEHAAMAQQQAAHPNAMQQQGRPNAPQQQAARQAPVNQPHNAEPRQQAAQQERAQNRPAPNAARAEAPHNKPAPAAKPHEEAHGEHKP